MLKLVRYLICMLALISISLKIISYISSSSIDIEILDKKNIEKDSSEKEILEQMWDFTDNISINYSPDISTEYLNTELKIKIYQITIPIHLPPPNTI